MRSRSPAQWRSPRRPLGLASRVLWRETDACAVPRDCLIDCCELGRTRGARYQIADIPAGKRLPKWHTHMVRIAGPRLKRRAPGFRRDRRGLSHSDNSHTTIYRLTLPSVEHAGCAGLHTRQSRTELATEETAVIRAMARTQAHAVSTRQRLGGRIFRAAMRADGRWIMRRAAGRV